MNNPDPSETAVFETALNCGTPEERKRYLDKACANNPEKRRRVEELLASHEAADAFMEQPAGGIKATVKLELPADDRTGQVIGRYKLLQKIGEGGCGVVYMAEQAEPVKRRLALKIIKLGMDTKHVVARFEAERQALAMMDHPNIAKVLDAGATENGRPYFVMELVSGIKITEYCDKNNLSTQERLKLFMSVCQAIQHAHQKGIIHRDIKPSNILVAMHDGGPIAKVIDFGIAKATQGRLTDRTLFTAFEQFIGTPAYMSPEQAEMSGLDVDTRTDIYSLGVLLYELLTGRTPFDSKELLNAGLDALRKTIREKEPQRPSTRLSTMEADALSVAAAQRDTDAPRLVHLIRGDLDWIVMKALEKDRTRRYETANGMATDVQRYLSDEPIAARPPSKLYHFGKTVRRNRLAFAAAAVTTVALIGGVVVSSLQALRARRAEAVARQERDATKGALRQAEAISKFLKDDVLLQASPDRNASEAMRTMMKGILDRAAQKLDHDPEYVGHPELEATLRVAVGQTYRELGDWHDAETNMRRAVTLRRNTLGAENKETLLAQKYLACLLSLDMNQFDGETERLSQETAEGLERLAKNADGTRDKQVWHAALEAQSAYIWYLANTGEAKKGAELKQKNVAAYEECLGADHHDSITALQDLAVMYESQGDFAKAEHSYEMALKRFERTGRANTYDGFECLQNMGWCRFLRGDAKGAEAVLADAQVRAVRAFSPEHPMTLDIQHRLSRVYADEGRWKEAGDLIEKTVEARKRVLPANSGRTAYSMVVLGRVLMQRGELDRAEPLFAEAQGVFRQYYAKQTRLVATAEHWMGAVSLARKDYAQAERLMLPLSAEFLGTTIQMSPQERRECIGHIVELYKAQGKAEEAAKWQQHVDELRDVVAADKPLERAGGSRAY